MRENSPDREPPLFAEAVKLSRAERQVLAALHRRGAAKDWTSVSLEELAREASVSRSSAKRSRDRLVASALLERHPDDLAGAFGRGHVTRYRLHRAPRVQFRATSFASLRCIACGEPAAPTEALVAWAFGADCATRAVAVVHEPPCVPEGRRRALDLLADGAAVSTAPASTLPARFEEWARTNAVEPHLVALLAIWLSPLLVAQRQRIGAECSARPLGRGMVSG